MSDSDRREDPPTPITLDDGTPPTDTPLPETPKPDPNGPQGTEFTGDRSAAAWWWAKVSFQHFPFQNCRGRHHDAKRNRIVRLQPIHRHLAWYEAQQVSNSRTR